MSRTTARGALTDHQTHVARTVFTHRLVERYRLGLAVGRCAEFGLRRGLPFLGKAVRNRAEIADPMIHHTEGNFAVAWLALGEQKNRPNPTHLDVVRRGFHAHEKGIRKAGGAGEPNYRE